MPAFSLSPIAPQAAEGTHSTFAESPTETLSRRGLFHKHPDGTFTLNDD